MTPWILCCLHSANNNRLFLKEEKRYEDNANSDEGVRILHDLTCLISCNVWCKPEDQRYLISYKTISLERRRTITRKAAEVSLNGVLSLLPAQRIKSSNFSRYCSIWCEVFQHRKYWLFWILEQNVFPQRREYPLEGSVTNDEDMYLCACIECITRETI